MLASNIPDEPRNDNVNGMECYVAGVSSTLPSSNHQPFDFFLWVCVVLRVDEYDSDSTTT